MERRLAAILAADVVGYSWLMEADEEATVSTLSTYREKGVGRMNHQFSTFIQRNFALSSILFGQNIGLQNGDAEMSGNSPGRTVVYAFGELLTVETLPPADTVRWVPRRKAQLVCAVRGGLISRQEACDRYGISDEELFSWEKLLDDHGLRALRVTSTQRYRQATTSTGEDAEGRGPA